MPNPMTGAGYSQGKEEDDSYLKDKRRKDEDEKVHLRKYVPPVMKGKSKGKSMPPVMKGKPNPKKKALQSMLGSLSSGANFRN